MSTDFFAYTIIGLLLWAGISFAVRSSNKPKPDGHGGEAAAAREAAFASLPPPRETSCDVVASAMSLGRNWAGIRERGWEFYKRRGLPKEQSHLLVLLALRHATLAKRKKEEAQIRAVLAALPFRFSPAENILWAKESVPLSTIKTTSKLVGRSHGFSVRIAKGLYYRTGTFGGQRVSGQELVSLGNATVAITSKHLYYSGGIKGAKRIKHEKIVSVTTYADGVLVAMEGASQPLFFELSEPELFAGILQKP